MKLQAVIECFPINFGRPMRDPNGEVERYKRWNDWGIRSLEGGVQERYNEALVARNLPRVSDHACNAVDRVLNRMLLMYACGEPLSSIALRLEADLPFVMEVKALRSAVFTDDQAVFFQRNYDWPRLFTHALVCLLASDTRQLTSWLSLFRTSPKQQAEYPDERSYYIDVLLRAFAPDWPVERNKHTLPKRDRGGERRDSMEALFRALAEPSREARSEGLGRYMAGWNRRMKPYGWKPKRNYPPLTPGGGEPPDHLWVEFAFEAALAVCGWDLDDSAFRDHPYYPRDLVDHYRTHLRHTRDAWRADGVGAGIAIEAPPPPRKLDLDSSKSKGILRWLELVADGDAEAIAAVVDQIGKPRKVKDLAALSCALAESGAGIHADIKDHETLESHVDSSLARRGLADFDPAGVPPAGPARCAALLRALDRWLADKAHRLYALDLDGDAWSAVLVPRRFAADFESLCTDLGIAALDPASAFEE